MSIPFRVIVCCILYSSLVNSARILAVFSNPSYSHHQVFKRLIDALLDNGHEIVVITACPAYPKETPTNLTQIDVQDISLKIWTEEMSKTIEATENNFLELVSETLKLFVKLSEKQFQTDQVLKVIEDKNNKFDLIVTESLMKMNLMISDMYKLPVIEINSFGPVYADIDNMGSPVQPLLYPQTMRKRLANLTFFEEITELYADIYMQRLLFNQLYADSNKAMKNTLFKSAPGVEILQDNVHLLYMNTHPVWDAIRPVPLSVIYTYGIHQKPQKELPKDLSSYMNASVNGVVYVSFGTTANKCQYSTKVQTLLSAFSRLPYDVLFKWHEDELPGKPDNVKISQWFPQADLLKHPKVKVFITQCGIQSTDEAIDAGVPLIGVPLIWDQWANAERYIIHGIGVKLDIKDITEQQIVNAVNTVVTDNSYRTNMIKLRTLLMDSPQRPSERVVRWTQYMLRHGGARHLRAPAANMSHAEFFEIELFLIIFLFSTIFLLYFYILSIKYIKPSFDFTLNWLKTKIINSTEMSKKFANRPLRSRINRINIQRS
ncbi:UDP-glucosyltransferase 2-like [Achroia grisella]|uniref:UDP-glucosyltransferase 2-like n=1 Tax=Achroia grisella TaxID=688607 RepID=UPI0027D23D5D|nr:UDP-glucosyltransferase 2-like [Achroia grisella]